jgi:hypothetical protein
MKSKKSADSPKRRTRRVDTGPEAMLERHRAQCRICRHEKREEIEADFLDWVPAGEIAEEYKLGSHRAVYRHAHAFGLFDRRRGFVERALDNIIERSGEAKITAGAVVAAIRLMVDIRSGVKGLNLLMWQEPAAEAAREAAKRAARRAAGRFARDSEDDKKWAKYSPLVQRALKASERPVSAQAPPLPTAPATEKVESKATPVANVPKDELVKVQPAAPASVETKSSKPAAPPVIVPVRDPLASEPGTRREPDGPPQVAGMAWPWAKGSSPFARRSRWRGRPVVG